MSLSDDDARKAMDEFHSEEGTHALLVAGVEFELDPSVDDYFKGINSWSREDREVTEDTVVFTGQGSGVTAQEAYFNLRDSIVAHVEAYEKENTVPMVSMRIEDVTTQQDGDDWTVTASVNFAWFSDIESAMGQLLAALGGILPTPSAN